MSNRAVYLAALLTAFTLMSSAKDSGFEGKWIIDKNASTANFDIPDNFAQQIKLKGSEIAVQTTWKEPKNGMAPLPLLGLMVTDSKLVADGQEQRNQVGPFVQVTKTTTNANQMVTEYNAASEEGKTVQGRWTRTLSEDGKQMILEITQTGAGQNAEGRLVFRRK